MNIPSSKITPIDSGVDSRWHEGPTVDAMKKVGPILWEHNDRHYRLSTRSVYGMKKYEWVLEEMWNRMFDWDKKEIVSRPSGNDKDWATTVPIPDFVAKGIVHQYMLKWTDWRGITLQGFCWTKGIVEYHAILKQICRPSQHGPSGDIYYLKKNDYWSGEWVKKEDVSVIPRDAFLENLHQTLVVAINATPEDVPVDMVHDPLVKKAGTKEPL